MERLATLCGAVADSFEKGTELLHETAGIHLSESTVQRTTEAVGERIVEHYQRGQAFGCKKSWDWNRDALGRTVGYIGIDATGVRQQGAHGKQADGRMAYVGMIFNPPPHPSCQDETPNQAAKSMKARYVSGLYPLAEMGPLLRRQGNLVGLDRAKVWVALSDGGSGLEAFLNVNFSRVDAVILDFFHAAEYLGELSRALHGSDEAKRLEQTTTWTQMLHDQGGPR